METIFLISLLCTAFAVVWVHELTHTEGLLWFIPKYYPPIKIIKYILMCEVCLSGWSSLVITIPLVYFVPFGYLNFYLIPACLFMSMFLGHIYKRAFSKAKY